MNATQHVLKCMFFVVFVFTVFAGVVVFTVFARKQQQTMDTGFFVMVFAGGMGVIVK